MGDGGGTDYQNGIWLPKRSSAHSEGCFTVTQDLSTEDSGNLSQVKEIYSQILSQIFPES